MLTGNERRKDGGAIMHERAGDHIAEKAQEPWESDRQCQVIGVLGAE
jgi:hypothetical protein